MIHVLGIFLDLDLFFFRWSHGEMSSAFIGECSEPLRVLIRSQLSDDT